ncbi:MAG TPA: FGGY family carbohydrate kinase, partial [Bacteroidales bacterium]|nr:FGGY family carbohydrate kinase [Bacteroidales bacterium]
MNAKEKKYIIVIDAGTQSIRAAIIDLKGNICAIERVRIESYFSDHPGFAEQDPEYLWDKLCETTQRLIKNISFATSLIYGLSITTQRGSVVNLDEKGKPLRPAIIWLDQRKAKVGKWPKGLVKKGLQLINMYESLAHAIKDGESNWIRQNQPEIWKKTYKYVFLSAFFNYRFTGKFIDSVGSMVGYMPFDYKKQQWANPGSLNTKLFPVEREKLVDLVKPSELLGQITQNASRQTGLPEGLPIIATAADKAC